MMKALVMPVLLCGLIAAAPQRATAATDPLFKCASSKVKAASKKEQGKFNCLSKNAAKPDPTALGECLAKVESKFDPSFVKADSKGACTGRSVDVESTVDLCIDNTAALIPGAMGSEKCTSSKLKAVGKGSSGQLKCYSKAVSKRGLDVDPACLQKASDGVTTAFGKADKKGACPGDPAAVNAQVSSGCVLPVAGELPPKAPGCGNGIVEGFPPFNETCDDGNTVDGDSCPASCHVDSCTAVPASSFGAHVTYAGPGGTTISGLGYFVDYPEGKITNPSATAPFGVSNDVNQLGYGFTVEAVKLGGLPSPLLTLTFQTCQGAPAATATDFTCKVTDASDDLGNVVDPNTVTCTVTVP
jgi:cysteine-rich repeat protein